MKVTLEIPDSLVHEIKLLANHERREFKDLVADLLRQGFAQIPRAKAEARRVKLPLIQGRKSGILTPEDVDKVLGDLDSSPC